MDSVILAGGESRRMGTEKADLRLGDRSFLQVLLDVLAPISERVLVVGRHNASVRPTPALTFIPDALPGAGPLGGLITGFAASHSEKIMSVACDMPLVTAEAVELLVQECDERHDVAVPETDGRLHPLCAAYRRDCLPAMQDAFDRGERAVLSFYDRVRVKRVTEERLRTVDPELRFLTNVNHWLDYRELILDHAAHHLCGRT